MAGIAEGLAPAGAEWPLALIMSHSLLIAILLFEWCGAHARENHLFPPTGAKLLSAFVPPLGEPYYLLAGYGIKDGGIRLFKTVIFFLLCQVSYNGLFSALQMSARQGNMTSL